MKRPVTVLGAGQRPNAPANPSSGTMYAVIPLVIALPLIGYFMAQVCHLNVDQFAPLLFILAGLGLTAVFYTASEEQRKAAKAAKLKARETPKK